MMGRITVNGSTAYLDKYMIRSYMKTTNMGMSRITGDTGFDKSFISTNSDGTQKWKDNSFGEGISVTTPSGLRIYYGGALLTLVEGSSIVTPVERYRLYSGTGSKEFYSSIFVSLGGTQKAYILLQGGGGGGGMGGGYGLTNDSKDGGGGGGGSGGLLLVKYTLSSGTSYGIVAGSGGTGATSPNGSGSDGGTSSFNHDGLSLAQAFGGGGGGGKAGGSATGGNGGTTNFYTASVITSKSGVSGGGSNSNGTSTNLSNLGSLSDTFGYINQTGTNPMKTFLNGAASKTGGTVTGDNNRGAAGGGGASFYGNGGNVTKTSAGYGGTGAGGGGGTSRTGGGGPSGARGGNGFVTVYF